MPAAALNRRARPDVAVDQRARRGAALAWAFAGLVAVTGCAGARVVVTAARCRYPLSLSPEVRDGSGRLYDARTLTKVGTLDVRQTSVGFLYSILTPRSTRDFSDQINAQVTAAGGEAVVGLTLSVRARCEWINGFPLLDALPIWPGCVPVRLTGDIVRR